MNDYLSPLGRLLPSGSCGGVGLSGLTLGGGYGFFARQHDLTCDFLKYVRAVTNEGVVINSDDVSELLWACRGGGNGHFGIITSMHFSTVKLPPTFTTQKFRAYNLNSKRAAKLIAEWFNVVSQLPDPDLKEPTKAYYGKNLERLKILKKKLDPDNFFQQPQSLG